VTAELRMRRTSRSRPTPRTGAAHRHGVRMRHEGADGQWMRVPPEEVSVHLGSYPGDELEQSGLSKPRGQKAHEWCACERAGRNVSESRVGLESAVVDADSALTGKKAAMSWESTDTRTRDGPPG
jgi:hypothetical protein